VAVGARAGEGVLVRAGSGVGVGEGLGDAMGVTVRVLVGVTLGMLIDSGVLVVEEPIGKQAERKTIAKKINLFITLSPFFRCN